MTVFRLISILLTSFLLFACGEKQWQQLELQTDEMQSPSSDELPPDPGPTDPGSSDPTDPIPPTTQPAPTDPDVFPNTWSAAWSAGRPLDSERTSWTEHLYQETLRLAGPSLTSEPLDLGEFCPNWKQLGQSDRRAFLVVLLSVMAKYESNFDPDTQYEEDFNDAQGRPIVSRGLLQLSVESANSYGCNVTNATLHEAKTNLSCGLRIINRWIAKDKYFGTSLTKNSKTSHFGGARYWSVLRASSNSRSKIISYLKSQPACKK